MSLSDLHRSERQVYSQNGEDGVLESIFSTIGVKSRYFVEFGCEYATECNSRYLLEQGWRGLFMDGLGISRHPLAIVRQEFITAENINELLDKYGVPETFDLLSIDIDGNDYWVWRSMARRPRVVAIEYNAHVEPRERKVIPYDPNFKWSGTDYFGASLRALQELGTEKGYTLLYCDRTGVNAFFVSTCELPIGFEPKLLEEIYRPPNFYNRGLRHKPDPDRRMVDPRSGPMPQSGCEASKTKGIRLELGSGKSPTSGYLHHDRTRHSAEIDVVHNLDVLPWPWPDESCSEILALDVFAHLHRMPAEWLRECHRLLMPGCSLRFRVPIFGSPWHVIDPTHVRGFHPLNFDYFVRGRDLHSRYGSYYFDFSFGEATITHEEHNILVTLKK